MADTFHNWVQVPRHVFGPLTAESREDYFAVLVCFEADFEPALNLEVLSARLRDIAPHLAADDAALRHALWQLCEWKLLEESRDDSVTYNDPAEFRRRHAQWSLTGEGQATIAALHAAFDKLQAATALQPAAIDAIAAALSDVAELLERVPAGMPVDTSTADRVHVRLFEAESHHRSLIDNLRAFTRDITQLLGRSDLGDDDLNDAKRRIVTYLDQYVVGTEAPARRVAAAMERLERIGYEHVAFVAVEGEHVAPGLDPEERIARARAARLERLRALHSWFASTDTPPLFSELLPRGRDAVLSYLRVLGIRREVTRRNASLPEDFRTLARVFAAADGDTDAHLLWAAATGLTPARHHHTTTDDTSTVASRGNRTAQNPSAALTVELRRRPRSTGRPSHGRPVADRRHSRAAAQAREAAELAEKTRRRQQLTTDGPTRLSHFAQLDAELYPHFAELLAAALSAHCDESGNRTARSADGHVLVSVAAADDHARSHVAVIETPTGRLAAPDLAITIEILGRRVSSPAGTEPLEAVL